MKRTLRFTGIILLAITSVFTLLSGVGTTCVALDPTTGDNKFIALAPFQWLYIFYVLTGVALGILGIRATIMLIKGRVNGERSTLIMLILSLITGGAHMITSRLLRGSSMPTDGVVYFTVLTLIVFLIFQIPKIREMGLYQEDTPNNARAIGGLSAIIMGSLFLSVQMWAVPDHLINGINYADAFHGAIYTIGGILVIIGAGLFVKSILFPLETPAAEQPAR
jgi:hypothetical protein